MRKNRRIILDFNPGIERKKYLLKKEGIFCGSDSEDRYSRNESKTDFKSDESRFRSNVISGKTQDRLEKLKTIGRIKSKTVSFDKDGFFFGS
ncbi:hypothetical protein DLM77_03525 [Leptospira yasudae]|uniref:Uncharacterized protein n=1 Tax=Leptospira yasudae TaxID=2202201 RepID=A0ABX9M5M1_9LEPT|nr:hypothetical protein DLM77_03525 [Leptospira yasudae]